MNHLKGKRLLLLGGSKQYIKVAKTAKSMEIYLIVVDRNPVDEIVEIADECVKIDLLNSDSIGDWCEKNPIDGVINLYVDFAQHTLFTLCNRFSLPCCYTKEQIETLADKNKFKKKLQEFGLDVIKTYSEMDVKNDLVSYPIIIKPAEGSGSRGSTSCFNKNEAIQGIAKAKMSSRNGEIVIEELIQNSQELQVTYFVHNGKIELIRTADSFNGELSDQLNRVVICSISPSHLTEEYLKDTNQKVKQMINGLGIRNGPVFMQGFFHNGSFKFFDPGCRFPGVDFDKFYLNEFGIDIPKMLVEYAITGNMIDVEFPSSVYKLNNKLVTILFPTIKPGTIVDIRGTENISSDANIFSISYRHKTGDLIEQTSDVNQRFGEIDIMGSNSQEICATIENVNKNLHIIDELGNEMLYKNNKILKLLQERGSE